MKQDLKRIFNVEAATLYDRAPAWVFRPYSVEEQHTFMNRFLPELRAGLESSVEDRYFVHSFKDSSGAVQLHPDRPFILVSCTSWTPDEDFQILLDALNAYDGANSNTLPRLLVIITGKGPLKEYYLEKINDMQCKRVKIVTAWLAAEDYPKLLATADLGVSLHTSTSGLDLPMKIVDMFGCHLPVVAKRFSAIEELVTDGENGILFDTPQELKTALLSLSEGWPRDSMKLDAMKTSMRKRSSMGWDEQWNSVVWPMISTQN